MDIQDNGKTVSVDGAVFSKLSPNDRRKLLAPAKAARRANLKQDLKDGGIVGAEYVNELDAFDQMVLGDGDFFKFLQSIEGRAEIIDLACRKANGDEKAPVILDALAMALDEDFTFAAKLAGVKLINTTDQPATESAETEPRPSVAGS